jgi:hypothetical protein
MEIDRFVNNMKPITNLDEFVLFKDSVRAFMKWIFATQFSGKSEQFVLAFDQSNVSKYATIEWEDSVQERRNIRNLIKEKNKLYAQILLKASRMGLMDDIISPDEKHDIECIVMSGIASFFDDVYINWLESTADANTIPWLSPEKPLYGGIQDGKVVGYGAFSQMEIDVQKLESIKNPHIRAYLLSIYDLLSRGVSDYQEWVDAERHESKIWRDQASGIWFVSPMENYVDSWLLVSPELIFLLKDHRNPINYDDLCNLSSEYFGDHYGMDNMTCTYVESILNAWDAVYSPFIGKTFPNDLELWQSEGNNIIILSSLMKLIVTNSESTMKKLFPGISIDMENLRLELLKEVTYHEFGHSLFIKWHPTSILEETKATLFYFLRIHQEHTQKEYSREDIERVVCFTIMDSLRTIERIDQGEYFKYTILMKVVLAPLFSSGLVTITPDGLHIDPNREKFDIFLSNLKDFLFEIQRIYTLDTTQMQWEEAIILEKLNKDTETIIAYISQIIMTK